MDIEKEAEGFILEKLALVSGVSEYFNKWLGVLFGVVAKDKPSKEYLLNALSKYKEDVFYLMKETEEVLIGEKLDVLFKESDELKKEPFVAFLYSKFTVVFSVFHDTLDVPLPESEKKEIREGLFTNMEYFIEILFDFVEHWDSEMSISEVQELVNKLGSKFNKKYDTKGYEMFS